MNRNFVKSVLHSGGQLIPLMISAQDSNGLGLCNPSIFIDTAEPWCILRNVNYTLYHAENNQIFNDRWGPLSYLNPENDLHLRTWNFLLKLNPDLSVSRYWKIDTAKLDKEPLWEFVGLEDARLVRWNHYLYAIGVRRDTTTTGQGRMELSRMEYDEKFNRIVETKRYRIEHPTNPDWYCEKNWMPIIDMPYHFVKFTNPVEVVQCDIETLKSWRIRDVDEAMVVPNLPFLRGGSQVIPWKDYRFCLVHEVDLERNYLGQKDAAYRHRFVTWDKEWNLINITEPFSFMGGEVEFCPGAAIYNDDLLVSFGFQDNCAFLLKVPSAMIEDVLGIKTPIKITPLAEWQSTDYPTLEVSTGIGCSLKCAFCPQDKIMSAYQGRPSLTLDGFKTLIAKVPPEVQITFAGFFEPFLNPDCTDMILYAHSEGHAVSVFTTGVGLSFENIHRIKHIPFSGVQGGFVLHLPDEEGYFVWTNTWSEPAAHLLKQLHNFQAVTMGTLRADLKDKFPNTITQTMYSRAGNVGRDDVIKTENKGPCTCACREGLYHNVLLPNGDIALCCMDYGLRHILGKLYESNYEDIIPKPGTAFELCSHCENGIPV